MSTDRVLSKIQTFVIRIRERRNLAQSQFAAALGVAKGYVSKTEATGFTRPPIVYIELLTKLMTKEEKAELLDLLNEYFTELLKLK
jgi:transcriptional regulator with XRE-family HTH domain